MAALAADGNTSATFRSRHRRRRSVTARQRWARGLVAVTFIVRVQRLMKPRLLPSERLLMRLIFEQAGALQSAQQISEVLSAAGIYCGVGDIDDFLTNEAGLGPGDVLVWRHFLLLIKCLKRNGMREAAMSDAQVAFVALGGEEDQTGEISARELKRVITNFALKVDIDAFIEEHDEDGSGNLEFNEFKSLFAPDRAAAAVSPAPQSAAGCGPQGADHGGGSSAGATAHHASHHQSAGAGAGGADGVAVSEAEAQSKEPRSGAAGADAAERGLTLDTSERLEVSQAAPTADARLATISEDARVLDLAAKFAALPPPPFVIRSRYGDAADESPFRRADAAGSPPGSARSGRSERDRPLWVSGQEQGGRARRERLSRPTPPPGVVPAPPSTFGTNRRFSRGPVAPLTARPPQNPHRLPEIEGARRKQASQRAAAWFSFDPFAAQAAASSSGRAASQKRLPLLAKDNSGRSALCQPELQF